MLVNDYKLKEKENKFSRRENPNISEGV